MTSLNTVVRCVCIFLLKTGFGQIIRWWHKKHTLILLYHGISNARGHLDRKSFNAQIEYLSSKYTIISLDYFLHCIKSNMVPPENSLIITFDDGYQNNYANAFPILKKNKVSASIFLVSSLIGKRQLLWVDEFYYRVAQILKKEGTCTLELRHTKHVIQTESQADKVKEELKTATQEQVQQVLSQIRKSTSAGYEKTFLKDHLLLSFEQIRLMQKNNVAFYAHGHTHAILKTLEEKELRKEIVLSLQFMKKNNLNTNCYAYANGRKKDFDDCATTLLAEQGVRTALTTIPGWNTINSEPFSLKRLSMGATQDWNSFLIRIHFGLFL
ncbi:MAG: polysaccharide deacetylase family protein [Candidatus Woesearchaeota archaeon]|nr:polysaccharide deacetylase family protein [Candidatus Woesearchaeota archaeon]